MLYFTYSVLNLYISHSLTSFDIGRRPPPRRAKYDFDDVSQLTSLIMLVLEGPSTPYAMFTIPEANPDPPPPSWDKVNDLFLKGLIGCSLLTKHYWNPFGDTRPRRTRQPSCSFVWSHWPLAPRTSAVSKGPPVLYVVTRSPAHPWGVLREERKFFFCMLRVIVSLSLFPCLLCWFQTKIVQQYLLFNVEKEHRNKLFDFFNAVTWLVMVNFLLRCLLLPFF